MDIYQVWRYKTRWGADYRVGDKGVFHIPPPGRVMFMPRSTRAGSKLVGYIQAESKEGALIHLQSLFEGMEKRLMQ